MPNAPLTKIYLPTGKKVKYVYDALNRLGEKGIVTDEDEYFSELYSYEEGGYREYTVYNSLLKNNIPPFCTAVAAAAPRAEEAEKRNRR